MHVERPGFYLIIYDGRGAETDFCDVQTRLKQKISELSADTWIWRPELCYKVWSCEGLGEICLSSFAYAWFSFNLCTVSIQIQLPTEIRKWDKELEQL